jgi:hypothetical protein
MNRSYWLDLIEELHGAEYRFGVITPTTPVYRVEFDAGLTDAEVRQTEEFFGFRFPPDLRDFLQTASPRGPQFRCRSGSGMERFQEVRWTDGPCVFDNSKAYRHSHSFSSH